MSTQRSPDKQACCLRAWSGCIAYSCGTHHCCVCAARRLLAAATAAQQDSRAVSTLPCAILHKYDSAPLPCTAVIHSMGERGSSSNEISYS